MADLTAAFAAFEQFLSRETSWSDKQAYAFLGELGLDADQQRKMVHFTQTACGRIILAPLGVQFSYEYAVFNREGTPIEEGDLRQNMLYQAAEQFAYRQQQAHWFTDMGLRSAELNAVNQALHNGSNPADLQLTVLLLMAEEPTEAGVARINAYMRRLHNQK